MIGLRQQYLPFALGASAKGVIILSVAFILSRTRFQGRTTFMKILLFRQSIGKAVRSARRFCPQKDCRSALKTTIFCGILGVTNSSGRSLTKRDNMRLYNGCHLETEAKSYAWINLDSEKLTKLDAVSKADLLTMPSASLTVSGSG